jgi:hypothetical protein
MSVSKILPTGKEPHSLSSLAYQYPNSQSRTGCSGRRERSPIGACRNVRRDTLSSGFGIVGRHQPRGIKSVLSQLDSRLPCLCWRPSPKTLSCFRVYRECAMARSRENGPSAGSTSTSGVLPLVASEGQQCFISGEPRERVQDSSLVTRLRGNVHRISRPPDPPIRLHWRHPPTPERTHHMHHSVHPLHSISCSHRLHKNTSFPGGVTLWRGGIGRHVRVVAPAQGHPP